jgi:hypothetical protein
MKPRLKTLPDGDRAKKQSLALYKSDLDSLERIRQYHELDSLSQAVRKAIRKEAAWVAFETQQKAVAA